MKLIIVTDLNDLSWLKYIISQFIKIQLPLFKISIENINKYKKKKDIVYLYYTKELKNFKTGIIRKDQVYSQGNINYINNLIYIIPETKTKGILNYDPFWNAFYFLSRIEEWLSNNINSNLKNHPRKDKTSFHIPIVNNIFNNLESVICEKFPELKFKKKQKAKIELSHDVDYLRKTIQLLLKQTGFNTFNSIKSISQINKFKNNLFQTIKFLKPFSKYFYFDYWLKLENKTKFNTIFYFYSKVGQKNIKQWLIDPSYNIVKERKLLSWIITKQNNFKVGIHTSIKSASNEIQMRKEKEQVEDLIKKSVFRNRQHWLTYNEEITPYLHNKMFKYDSTLGWNDSMGFRSGIASIYNPYDHKNKKAFDFEEIPLIIMDSNIFDYGSLERDSLIEKCYQIIETAKNVKNSYFALSWHQRVCSPDYNWHYEYENILKRL